MFESCRVVMLISIFSGIGLAGFAAEPGTATLSSTPMLHGEAASNSLNRVQGTVTFIDSARRLIVLQNGADALALQLNPMGQVLEVGERVELEGKLEPLIPALSGFPDAPDGTRVCANFEAPTNWGDNVLSRLRGVLHPTVTGNYTFWIASDDSSELWLSDDEEPGHAHKIAQIGSGHWTEAHQWTRYASQQSREVGLEAGRDYYLEALGQNTVGQSHLSIAWQGPGFQREIIDGKFLSLPPVPQDSGMKSREQGVVWEFWENFYSRDLSILKATDPHILKLSSARI